MTFDKQGKPPFRHILRQEVLPDKVVFSCFFIVLKCIVFVSF